MTTTNTTEPSPTHDPSAPVALQAASVPVADDTACLALVRRLDAIAKNGYFFSTGVEIVNDAKKRASACEAIRSFVANVHAVPASDHRRVLAPRDATAPTVATPIPTDAEQLLANIQRAATPFVMGALYSVAQRLEDDMDHGEEGHVFVAAVAAALASGTPQ